MGNAQDRLPSREVTSGAIPGWRGVGSAQYRLPSREVTSGAFQNWRGVGNAQDRFPIRNRAWSAPVNSYSSVRARLQLPYRAWSAPVNSYSSVCARLQTPCSCFAQAISALEPSLFRVSGIDCRLGSHIVLRGMAGIISAKAIQLTSWRTISNISTDLAHLLIEKGIDSAIQAKFGDLKITT